MLAQTRIKLIVSYRLNKFLLKVISGLVANNAYSTIQKS